jgi:gliding motility-associated-like protein
MNITQGSSLPNVALGNDTAICGTISLVLNAGLGYTSYLWQNNSTNPTLNVSTAGTYWVSTQDSCGNTSSDSLIVSLGSTLPNVSLGNNATLCPGFSITLNAGVGYQSYIWQNNSTGQNFTASAPGTYWVSVQDSCGNISSDSVLIQSDNSPALSLGADSIICNDENLTLNPGSNYSSYLWQNGNTNQTFVVNGSGTYYVQVTSNSGCIYKDTVLVNTQDCDTLPCNLVGVPNAFSPNNDLENDTYCLQGWPKCVTEFHITIYDRWGEKMFESTDPAFCWDGVYKGQVMDTQVFVYYINAISKNNELINKSGNISLIR